MRYEHCNLLEHSGIPLVGIAEVRDENHIHGVVSGVINVVGVALLDCVVFKDYEQAVIGQHFNY